MTNQQSLFYWKELPDRDMVLDRVYAFIRLMHEKLPEQAAEQVMVKDMEFFKKALHDALLSYLHMVIEDEDWDAYELLDLSMEIDDPANLEEDLMMPEFSGKHFVVDTDEKISVQLGIRGEVTPIRLHFAMQENNGLYYLKLQRITAK